MNFSEAMRAQGFIEVDIEIDYFSALENGTAPDDVQTLWVLPLAPDRLMMKESSGLFYDYKLFFGDEILVEPVGESRYKLKSVVEPSPMCHFFCLGSGSPAGLTDGLHELGGEWETEMGALTTFHVPRNQLDAFQEKFGIDIRTSEELFSGVQPWEDKTPAKSDKPAAPINPPSSLPAKKSTVPKLKPISDNTRHLVLLGDSIFDNHAYVPNGPAVIDHLRSLLPQNWQASLIARDGDMVKHIEEQLPYLPEDSSHLVISIGGNDALNSIDSFSSPTETVRTALSHLDAIRSKFRRSYRAMLWMMLMLKRPLAVCTIYDSVPNLSPELKTALCIFNDTIVREANAAGVPVIDLRIICTDGGDYSELSPIEPSGQGGGKIAKAIVEWATLGIQDGSDGIGQ